LAEFTERAYELNEVSWWSHWADVVWLGPDAYVLLSRDFDEYFFNRAGFLRVGPDSEVLLEKMEGEFGKKKLTPYVFVQSESLYPRLLQKFSKSGYRISDQMSVMEMGEPSFSVNPQVTLEMGNKERITEWVDVYVRAFYGTVELESKVTPVLRRVSKIPEVGLLLAYLDGMVVGALALLRTDGMCGVYCVGTVPEVRGRRVASTMLEFASRLAVKEGRKLILQTILSDSVEPLYLRAGFRRVCLKELFVKEGGALKSQKGGVP